MCGKTIMLSHLVFREIQILNIKWAVALQWCSIATPNLQHKQPSYIANISC